MNGNAKNIIGFLLLAGLVVGGAILLNRKSVLVARYQVSMISPGKTPVASKVSSTAKRYINSEKWHVKWSPDGSECWVEIKRDAVQS